MPAKLFLVTGPVASGKTRTLLSQYRTRAAADIGVCLWLTPSERSRAAIQTQLLDQQGAILAPHLMTFPDFARRIVREADPGSRSLPELHQRLLLDSVLADLRHRGDLPYFAAVADSRGFGDAVFGLLTELKGQKISPEALAETVRQIPGADSDKSEEVIRIFAGYQERLAKHRLLDRETTYFRACELWTAGRPGPFARVRFVFVDGFVDFTPPQLDLLAATARTVDEVWITLISDSAGEGIRSELFDRPLKTVTKLNVDLPGQINELATDLDENARLPRPTGLTHLEQSLFRKEPRPPSPDAEGLQLIEAPGLLGEVRLVARAVKTLLLDGVAADDIIVTARELGTYADLIREVFAEYGLPVEVEGTDPLIRNPAVALFLRAIRLAEDGFPFAATTALLRSTYFRPAWSELESDPDVAIHAEVLLRLLGEPNGRDAYLASARLWAIEAPPRLEDEEAEESRHHRKHELAKRCLPFLERFFAAWDGIPDRAELTVFADRLREFASDLGLAREAETTDGVQWARFWAELDGWAAQEPRLHNRAELFRLLGTLAASSGMPRTPDGPGRVRVLPAEQARHLDCEHLFLIGLGERCFPELGGGGPVFDESERQAFRGAGLEVRSAVDRLPDEMLLFYQLVTRPRHRLVLSYPAVDAKGQDLLPSSFLTEVRECFVENAIPVERQRMLIEGYDRVRPLSPAEYRVRWAASEDLDSPSPIPKRSGVADESIAPELFDHIRAAGRIVKARLSREFTSYDGMLGSPEILAELRDDFGPKKVLSPTALEHYVACPFRFFFEDVLKLEPLADPGEEVEHTRRGAAVHRALSRLHGRLQSKKRLAPTKDLEEEFVADLRTAIGEYASRSSSPATKMLWQLEARRLERAAGRYGSHWAKFQAIWGESGHAPRPLHFEIDFGLPGAAKGPLIIRHEQIEVRIGGRIDRVDVAEFDDGTTAFWVIDYKTGKSGFHTTTDLVAMKKLQLPLYALAVESLVLSNSRPMGMVYWMVVDSGAKLALPGRPKTGWLSDAKRWPSYRAELVRWIATLAQHIRGGVFPLKPRSEDCTDTCPYGEVCRIAEARSVEKTWNLPLPVIAATDEALADE